MKTMSGLLGLGGLPPTRVVRSRKFVAGHRMLGTRLAPNGVQPPESAEDIREQSKK